jgi:hypothetical protein
MYRPLLRTLRMMSFLFAFSFAVPQVGAATYSDGSLLTSPAHSAVYQVDGGKRRPFVNSLVFHTQHADFSAVTTIRTEDLEQLEVGVPMPVKENTKLLKFPLNPKVYAVTRSGYIQHIPDTQTAHILYGSNWNREIIELPELYYLFYEKGPQLPSLVDTLPPVQSDSAPQRCKKNYETADFTLCHFSLSITTQRPVHEEYSSKIASFERFETYVGGDGGGGVYVSSEFSTMEEYMAFMRRSFSATDLVRSKNINGVDRVVLLGGRGGGSAYFVAYFNPSNNTLVEFVYWMGQGADRETLIKETEHFLFHSTTTPPAESEEESVDTATCSDKAYTKFETRTYVLCYRQMQFDEDVSLPRRFSLYAGAGIQGVMSIVSGYNSLESYVNYVEKIQGATDVRVTKNGNGSGIYRLHYTTQNGSESSYHVAYHNADTDQIILFSVQINSSSDKTSLDSETNNFRFKTDTANGKLSYPDSLLSGTCGEYAGYTKYTMNYITDIEVSDERYEFCVPSILTLVPMNPDVPIPLELLKGSVTNERFYSIISGKGPGTSYATIAEYIESMKDPIFKGYDFKTEKMDNGYTFFSYKYNDPEGGMALASHILNESVYIINKTEFPYVQDFFITFNDANLDSHATTIGSIQEIIKDTFVYFR